MNKTGDLTVEVFEFALQETFVKTEFGGTTFRMLLAAFSILFFSYLSIRDRWNVKKYEEKRKLKGLNNIIGPKPFPLLGNLLDIPYKFEGMVNENFMEAV